MQYSYNIGLHVDISTKYIGLQCPKSFRFSEIIIMDEPQYHEYEWKSSFVSNLPPLMCKILLLPLAFEEWQFDAQTTTHVTIVQNSPWMWNRGGGLL